MNKKQSATLIVSALIVAWITLNARYSNWQQDLIQVLGTLLVALLVWLAVADKKIPDREP